MEGRARRQDLLDHDLVEQILRHEVSSVLRKMDLSPKEEEDIERLGYSLVDRIVLGPISEAMVCVEIRVPKEGERLFGRFRRARHHLRRQSTRDERHGH